METITAYTMPRGRREKIDFLLGDALATEPYELYQVTATLHTPKTRQRELGALAAVMGARLLLVAGTSLVVQPAASLIAYFGGQHLAIVNRSTTPADSLADLCIKANIGEVLAF